MRQLEDELKTLIVESLELEDIDASSIDAAAPLFGNGNGDGLALDSIDALELSVALSKKYGVTLKADDDQTKEAFRSVSSLAQYISAQRSSS